MSTRAFRTRILGLVGLNFALVLSARGAVPEPYRFVIPKRNDIVLVASEPQGAINIDVECYVPIEQERILSFFSRDTKVYVPDVDIFDYQDRGQLTIPKKLPPEIQRQVNKLSRIHLKGVNIGALVYAQGALFTRTHGLYFWRIYSDRVLLLWQGKDNKRVLIRND